MFPIAVIVFREIIEVALVIGIVMAAIPWVIVPVIVAIRWFI